MPYTLSGEFGFVTGVYYWGGYVIGSLRTQVLLALRASDQATLWKEHCPALRELRGGAHSLLSRSVDGRPRGLAQWARCLRTASGSVSPPWCKANEGALLLCHVWSWGCTLLAHGEHITDGHKTGWADVRREPAAQESSIQVQNSISETKMGTCALVL